MKNHKRSRNFLLAAGFLMLFAALGPWNNRDIVGRVIFTIQSFLFFIWAYIEQKEVIKANKKEDKSKSV